MLQTGSLSNFLVDSLEDNIGKDIYLVSAGFVEPALEIKYQHFQFKTYFSRGKLFYPWLLNQS